MIDLKLFESDFLKFLSMIINKQPFSFNRFSDGEMYLLEGKKLALDVDHVGIEDKRYDNAYTPEDIKNYCPVEHKEFYKALRESFDYSDPTYYKGICCKCCQGEKTFEWMSRGHGKFTWSNLFVNSNYRMFLNYMLPALQNRRVFLICHESAKINTPFEVEHDFRVGNDAPNEWKDVLEEVTSYIDTNEIHNSVFLFACSTMANLLIYNLHGKNNNTFMDVGSTLNPFIGLGITRGYLRGAFHPQLTTNPIQLNLSYSQKQSFAVGVHNPLDINKTCIW